jgi:hypothetical protein
MSYEKCIIADDHGKREFHNVNGMWYTELMHEGEWALYEISEEMWLQSQNKPFGTRPRTVVVHSRIYDQYRPVYEMEMPAIWCGKADNESVECVPVTHKTERYDAVCHTELWPSDIDNCSECHSRIPDKFLVTWRMLNADCMDQTR